MPQPAFHISSISPPFLNSSSPWATTTEDLTALYASPHTGAITTRTSLLTGFAHDPSIHQYTFFSLPPSTPASTTATSVPPPTTQTSPTPPSPSQTSSLNTLGYSPFPLSTYLITLSSAATGKIPNFTPIPTKPILISVTGSALEVAQCYILIATLQATHPASLTLMMEINLSCPNIPGKPPPAYSRPALAEYLSALSAAIAQVEDQHGGLRLNVGVKTPPYTHAAQFADFVAALEGWGSGEDGCPVTFVTAMNTLGSCLVLEGDGRGPVLGSADGEGIGGMAGVAVHALALGNVRILRGLLDKGTEAVRGVRIIGVGGVADRAGFERMRAVGADLVACATAVGREGVAVFGKILGE